MHVDPPAVRRPATIAPSPAPDPAPGPPASAAALAGPAFAPGVPSAPASADRLLAALADPLTLLTALQLEQRDRRTTQGETQIESASAVAELREDRRDQAIAAAKRAAEKASGFLGLGGWLGKVVTAITVAVTAVTAVFTAGAGTALLVAGVVLMLSAEKLTEGLVELGVVSEDAAPWVEMGLQLAGTVLTLGSGAAASAPRLGATAAQVASQVTGAAKAAAGALQVAHAGCDVAGVSWDLAADEARLDADLEGARVDDAVARGEAALDGLARDLERYRRVAARLAAAREATAEARASVLGNLAR